MPTIERNGATIYYEELGKGFPILTFAPAGLHQVPVDMHDGRGGRLSAGMYFYVVRAAEGRSTGRFVFAP